MNNTVIVGTPPITIKQGQLTVSIKQLVPSVLIKQLTPAVTLKQGVSAPVTTFMAPIVVRQNTLSLTVTYPSGTPPTFVPFKFIATAGQSVFTLSSVPIFVLSLTINGVSQSQLNGDFTIVGKVLTLNGTLGSGDLLAGVYV